MNTRTIDRRLCLRALASSTFLAPTLRFFVRNAEAAAYPLRFLYVFASSGRYKTSRSTGTGAAYTLGMDMAPLEPWKNKLLIVDGIDLPPHGGEEHPSGRCSMLTGRMVDETGRAWKSRGISFDRYLAQKIGGGVSFYTAISGSMMDDTVVSWNAAGAANDSLLVGSSVFVQRLFPGTGPSPAPATPTPAAPAPMAAPTGNPDEVALYDHLMAEVKRLQRFAPKSEVEKLELHLQSLGNVRAGFAGTGGVAGLPGTMPPAATAPPRECGTTVNLSSATTDMDRLNLAIANALACGRARVGVVHLGTDDPYHNYSHNVNVAADITKLRQIDVERARQFATLLGYLDSFAEGTGTLLDNTVVVWGSECSGIYGGDGMDNGVHGTTYMPFTLAGGRNAGLKNGQRVVTMGRTSLDLLRAVAARLGVDASDFGDPAFVKGTLLDLMI